MALNGEGTEAATHWRTWPLSAALVALPLPLILNLILLPHTGHVTVDFIAHSADFNFIFILRYFDFAQ